MTLPAPLRALGRVSRRRWVQLSALLFSNAYVLSALSFIPCGYLQCSNCALSTFACPLILVQRAAVVASMGMFGMMSERILGSVGAALAMLVLFGALFGAWGCGWLCPFGFVQDLLAKVPVKKFRLPGWAGHFRLPLFVLLVAGVPYYTKSLFFCDVCPPGAVNRLWQQAAGIPLFFKTPEGILAVASLTILGLILVASIFIARPFCTLFCPIGGVQGLLNKVSGIFLRLDREGCVSCKKCQKVCPQGLDPSENPAHTQCTRCLACTDQCEHLKLDLRL